MSEVKKEINVQARIKTLDLLSFNAEKRDDDSSTIDPLKITYEIGINFNADTQSTILVFNCLVKIFKEPEKKNLLGSIETKGEFDVLNLQQIIEEKKGMPSPMLATFVGLLISSTRGMLTILSKATLFEKGVLPIINPSVFFQQALQPINKV